MPKANSIPILSKAASQYPRFVLAPTQEPKLPNHLREALLIACNGGKRRWFYQVLITTKQSERRNHVNA